MSEKLYDRWAVSSVKDALSIWRSVFIAGARQCGKTTLAHLAWFRDNIARQSGFTGVILYTGEHTLPFGKNLYGVPIGTLCT